MQLTMFACYFTDVPNEASIFKRNGMEIICYLELRNTSNWFGISTGLRLSVDVSSCHVDDIWVQYGTRDALHWQDHKGVDCMQLWNIDAGSRL